MLVNIGITTTSYGLENSWRIETRSKPATIECLGGNYASYATLTATCQLEEGVEYELICEDEWGDGWDGGYLEIAGQRYCEDFRFDFPNKCANVYQCNTERRIQYITIEGMIIQIALMHLGLFHYILFHAKYTLF